MADFKPLSDATEKFSRRVSQAGPDYQKGVQNASGWAQAAVAGAARRNAGLQQAISDGRIDRGIQATGDQGWRSATLAKGVTNYQGSAQRAGANYARGMQRTYNYLNQAKSATDGIDTSTLAGRLAKMQQWAQTMAEAAAADKRGG